MNTEYKSFSVKSYLTSIKNKLSETPAVWVHGVITQIVIKPKIVYINIADFEEGNVKPVAAISLSCFAPKYESLCLKTENSAKPFVLKEQMKVCFLIKADLYITLGKFQAQILDIDPIYTIGELAITRDAIFKRLTQEGLIDKNKKLDFAKMPLKVGLITGESTAAYKDFTTQLNASPFNFQIYTAYAKMQGNETETTILQALDALKQNIELDVVCIVRGGGAKTDLNYFDSEILCRAVANYPIPIITGIGHEIDKSLLDEVAYSSCITPTDCAKKLIEQAQSSWEKLLSKARNIGKETKDFIVKYKESLSYKISSLQHKVLYKIEREKSNNKIKQTILNNNTSFLFKTEKNLIERNIEGLKQGSRKILEIEKTKFNLIELKTKSADPNTILKKGYSLTLNKDGKIIKDIKQVQTGDVITTRLKDGNIQSIVQ